MKIRNGSNTLWALAVFALVLGATLTSAQTFPPRTIEYTAKFTCGLASNSPTMVKGETYATSINIHNPALPGAVPPVSVTFQKKAVQSIQEPPTGGTLPAPGQLVTDRLTTDYPEEVDCTTITTKLLTQPPPAGFVEGYAVIYSLPTVGPNGNSPNPLDVVGVYTDMLGGLELTPANEHDF